MGKARESSRPRVFEVLLCGAAYYALARVNQLIAPLTESTPIDMWLPTGLAVAAALTKGPWMAVGVLFGSFAFRLGTLPTGPGPAVALAIGLGFCVQTIAAERLYRRFIGGSPPQAPRQVARFIAIALGVSTVSAVFGMISLCLAGFEKWSSFLGHAVRWWLGSACGILILAPSLTLLWLRATKKRPREGMLWALGTLLFGVGLLAFTLVGEIDRRNAETLFVKDAHERAQVLQASFARDVEHLGMFGTFYSASGGEAELRDFDRIAHKLLEGAANAKIIVYAASGDNGQYLVAQRYPAGVSALPLGFDLGSDEENAAAIAEARDLGAPSAALPAALGEAGVAGRSAMVFVPLYRSGARTVTVIDRRRAFLGCVVGLFDLDAWVKSSLRAIVPPDIETFVYEEEQGLPRKFFAFIPGNSGRSALSEEAFLDPRRVVPGVYRKEYIDIAGRTLLLISLAGPDYQGFQSRWLAWGSLLVGSATAGAFLALMGGKQKREAAIARSEAEFRALSDDALTGVLRAKPSGQVLYANEAAARMFGYGGSMELKEAGLGAWLEEGRDLRTFFDGVEREGRIKDVEIEVVDRTGGERTFLVSGTFIEGMVNFTATDITERLRETRALRQFSRIIDQMADTVVVTDTEGRIEYVNPAFEVLTGYAKDEAVGKTMGILASGKHPPEFYEELLATIARGGVVQHDIVNRKKGGELYTETQTISPLRDPKGAIVNYIATGRDVTERKRMEAAIKAIERRNAALIEHAPDGIAILDVDFGILFASPAALKIYGLTEEALPPGSRVSSMIHPDDLPLLGERIVQALESPGAAIPVEYRIRRTDGEERWLECFYTCLANEEGRRQLVVNFRDETGRIRMEREIRERMKELTCLFEINRLLESYGAIEEGLFEGMLESLGKAMQFPESALPRIELDGAVHGFSGEGLAPGRWLTAPIEIEGASRGQVGVAYGEEHPFIMPEEQTLLRNVAHMLGLWLENLEAVSRLRESNERFQQLANSIQEAFWIYDLAAERMEFMGKAYEAIWGRSAESLIRNPADYMESVLPEDRPILRAAQARNRLNRTTDAEYRIRNVDGTVHLIWDRSYPILDAAGKVVKRTGVCTDITELKKTQNALEELNRELERRVAERTEEVKRREALYRGLFENSNDAIFLFDLDGKGIGANQRALDLIGCGMEEYLAMSPAELDIFMPGTAKAERDERLEIVARGETAPLIERLIVGKDGRRTATEINLSAVRDPGGKAVVVQAVVRDVSERRRAEERLRKSRDELSAMNAALQKASRLKDEFLASMSHELRTPLTGILGLSEAMQLQTFGALNERQAKALSNIEASGRHLLELINDILDLSKIEAGKLDLQIEACEAAEVCQSALQLVKGMAQQRGQNLEFRIYPASIRLDADQRRLKQMIVNLLSNAVKFTPEGGSLGLEVRGEARDGTVAFSVWDRGIGIKREDLDKLFKPFSQLDASLSRQYAGTGLGLSVVQKMAELHGGSVKVESVFGEGSRFTVVLPWRSPSKPAEGETGGGMASLREALVVEDNALDAERLSRCLRELGIRVIHLPAIDDALEKAAAIRPSAVLLDINLPDGSGLDLLARLKADPRTRDIPVVIVSVEDRRGEAARLGAVAYLLKPFSCEELKAALGKASVLASQNASLLILQGGRSGAPLVFLADDNELILEMVSDFLEAKGYEVVAVRSGPELLDLASELTPDLVLVDIQMPGMDGLETIRRLRALDNPLFSAVPVIAVTALAMTGDREACLQAGADEYVAKPFVLAQLEQLIRNNIQRKRV